MGRDNQKPHFLFFPFMSYGHMIPMVDMAKLFALRGVKVTIVTTPLNVPLVSKAIQKTIDSGAQIEILTIKFPAAESGLPEGSENMNTLTSRGNTGVEIVNKFFIATSLLEEPLEQLLEEIRPDCLVADIFFPWANDASEKFGIPRLIFHGSSCFSWCVSESIRKSGPHKSVSSDSEPFLVPDLPGNIMLTRDQMAFHDRLDDENDSTGKMRKMIESPLHCHGFVVNSFYELESAYVDYFKNVLGKKAWHVGPVSLCNKDMEDKALRGPEAFIDGHECLKWLDSRKPNSVVYICFGTVANFTASQLKEIAMALESSGQDFIWVVRKGEKAEGEEDWLPEGFETRMEGKGLIIREWAPQVLILEHEAVGGFVTHCGWNSTLEGITAGNPMVTWPVSAEQFYNEKLVTQVLRIGVAVGAQKLVRLYGDSIKKEAIEKAVTRIMVGEEAEEMRGRAKELGKMAKKAVEEGGSSYSDLVALIEEMRGSQLGETANRRF